MGEFRYIPPSHEIAASLLELAQDIEIGKGRVSVACPPFLREAADRVQRQHDEIEILREALRRIRDCDWVITLPDRMDAVRDIAREALGDE